jgi:hypothetical protein
MAKALPLRTGDARDQRETDQLGAADLSQLGKTVLSNGRLRRCIVG